MFINFAHKCDHCFLQLLLIHLLVFVYEVCGNDRICRICPVEDSIRL